MAAVVGEAAAELAAGATGKHDLPLLAALVALVADDRGLFGDGIDFGEVEGLGAAQTAYAGEDGAATVEAHADFDAPSNGHQRNAPKKHSPGEKREAEKGKEEVELAFEDLGAVDATDRSGGPNEHEGHEKECEGRAGGRTEDGAVEAVAAVGTRRWIPHGVGAGRRAALEEFGDAAELAADGAKGRVGGKVKIFGGEGRAAAFAGVGHGERGHN